MATKKAKKTVASKSAKSNKAPWGYKKDGTPKRKPGQKPKK